MKDTFYNFVVSGIFFSLIVTMFVIAIKGYNSKNERDYK